MSHVLLTAEQAQQIEEALDLFLSNVETPPDRNCSCHIAPPCNDCVDNSCLREAFAVGDKALATIRAARAQEQAEQDLDTCPGCGGVADKGHDREFPPNPYYCTKCSEQAEQEPVAWMNQINGFICKEKTRGYHVPLYAAPVRTKDLTDDEERQIITATVEGVTTSELAMFKAVARAVIAAYKEKNK